MISMNLAGQNYPETNKTRPYRVTCVCGIFPDISNIERVNLNIKLFGRVATKNLQLSLQSAQP